MKCASCDKELAEDFLLFSLFGILISNEYFCDNCTSANIVHDLYRGQKMNEIEGDKSNRRGGKK